MSFDLVNFRKKQRNREKKWRKSNYYFISHRGNAKKIQTSIRFKSAFARGGTFVEPTNESKMVWEQLVQMQ